MTKLIKTLALASALGAALMPAAVGAQTTFLRFAGGIGGSSWEITAGKIADMFSRAGEDIQAIAQPGSMGENLARLRRGEADIGISYGFVFPDVVAGTGDFEGQPDPNLRLLAALYPSYQQPLVPDDVPWQTVRDAAADPGDVRIAALTPGSGTYIMANAMMSAAGADLDAVSDAGGLVLPLNYAQGLDALRTGQANILPVNGPANHPSVVEFQNQGRLLTFDDELLEEITATLPGSTVTELPADMYPFLDGPYKTFAVYTSLVVSADVPEEVVYEITKYLWENVDEFRSVADYAEATDIASATVGSDALPLHPGALRYYQEVDVVE